MLTLHGLDEVLDGVRSDAESGTLLHQDRRDVAVHVQVVHRLRLQAERVHELPAGGDKKKNNLSAHTGPPMTSPHSLCSMLTILNEHEEEQKA